MSSTLLSFVRRLRRAALVGLRSRAEVVGLRHRPFLEELEHRLTPSVSLLTYHNDYSSSGENLSETALTPANVNSTSFGKLFSTPVDGQVYAQPLYVPGVAITVGPIVGAHNVTYVATEHDSVYAIDADSGQVLWRDNFINPAAGVTTVTSDDVDSNDVSPEMGITSTPVIDPTTNTLYVVANTEEVIGGNRHYIYRLHALDLGSGDEKFGGPAVIADTIWNGGNNFTYVSGPSVDGTGDGSVNGVLTFNVLRQLQRPALTLCNDTIFIGFGAHGTSTPYHGWLLGYNAQTLQPNAVFCTTPNGFNGGIWQGGGRIDVDAQGYLYIETGNGDFDTTLDANGFPVNGDYGDSFLKLAIDPTTSPTNQDVNGWGLKVVDYFTPSNQQTLYTEDLDLGSGGPLLLPDSVGSAAHPHLMVGGGKIGTIYLIDTDNMGKYNPTADQIVQELPGTSTAFSKARRITTTGSITCRASAVQQLHSRSPTDSFRLRLQANPRTPSGSPVRRRAFRRTEIPMPLSGTSTMAAVNFGLTMPSAMPPSCTPAHSAEQPRSTRRCRQVHGSHRCQRKSLCRHNEFLGGVRPVLAGDVSARGAVQFERHGD